MDNAATTMIRTEVLDVMMPYLNNLYGNSSSLHLLGRESKIAIDKARNQIANVIGAKDNEIYFTSGATESNNWALRGISESNANKGKHIITSVIEHPSILNTCKYLGTQGFEITYIPTDNNGIINLKELKNSIREDTILMSIMMANNEIGIIEPIKEIGMIAKENNIIFHTDAVQIIGKTPIDVKNMNIDSLSLSGHKLHSPKGIGALYLRNGIKINPLIHGGGQEFGLRSGTENVIGIAGLGYAIELANEELFEINIKIEKLRDKLINGILNNITHTKLNGSLENRLCNNVNISFDGIEGESLLLLLDMDGICVSTGSSCNSGSLNPSHVLSAIGLSDEQAHSSIRFSLSRYTIEEEIDIVIKKLIELVEKLRNMNPNYNK